jgi:hypothetical protein
MSSACAKCTKGVDHDPDVCPKNCTGSSKGMEAAGAARIANRLFLNDKDKCHIAHLVTDDDSSVRKMLTHSHKDLTDSLQATIDDWAMHANGQKKPNNGLLPILHPPITFLADKGHRNRGCSSAMFKEAMKSKRDGCGCVKIDAERMKRLMSWTLWLHSRGTLLQFQAAVKAVLEHHFNNHKHCEVWANMDMEQRRRKVRVRCGFNAKNGKRNFTHV